MVLIQNEGQYQQIQQVMMAFYEEFSRQNPSVINLEWDEEDEKKEDEKKEDKQKENKQKENKQKEDEKKENKQKENKQEESKQKEDKEYIPQKTIRPKLPSVTLWQNEKKIVRGVIEENGQVYVFHPDDEAAATRLAGQIEIIKSLPPGTVIPNAPNLRVEIETSKGEKQTVLETNAEGKITTNLKTQPPQISGTEVIQNHPSNQSKSNSTQSTINELIRVLERQQQFQELTLKQFVQQNQQLAQQNQQNQQLIKLLQERKQEPRNPKWWQKISQKISQTSPIKKWLNQRQEKQLASTLRDLYVKRSANGEKYNTPSYKLGSIYDSENNQERFFFEDKKEEKMLMEFSVDKDTGEIQVIKNQLSSETVKEIQQVKQALKRKNTTKLPLNFLTPVEYQASQQQQRQEKVTQELLRKAKGEARKINGKNYTIDISSKGDLTITAKDGRGTILHHSSLNQGNINLMNSNDLNLFEAQLAKQQATQTQNKTQTTSDKTQTTSDKTQTTSDKTQTTSDKTKTTVVGGKKR